MAFVPRPAGPTVSAVVAKGSDYADGMAAHDAIKFRQQAQEALEHAESAINIVDIKAWLLVAEDWLKLAQAVEAGHGN
jgi:hypothetical protein